MTCPINRPVCLPRCPYNKSSLAPCDFPYLGSKIVYPDKLIKTEEEPDRGGIIYGIKKG